LVVTQNSFLTSELEGVCGQHHASAAFTPGKDPVPVAQEAGWVPEPVWKGAENLAPPAFDPRTFQPVASRYDMYMYIYIYNIMNILNILSDRLTPC
jgi:hypothetical protein